VDSAMHANSPRDDADLAQVSFYDTNGKPLDS
jgi:hypothetical protein